MAAATGPNANFARIGMAIIGEETKMLREILENKIPPSDILKETSKRKLRLNNTQKAVLNRASTSDYSELDISLLYTLIRNICTSISPTNGWGGDEMPDINDVTIGDDIERIRIMRNEIYGHAADSQMSDADFQQHFNTIIDISKRMDTYFLSINKKTAYEKKIKEIETQILDDGIVQFYIDKIKDMEERESELKDIVRAYACGESFYKLFKKVSLKSSDGQGIHTQTYLRDLGVIINGIENFVDKESKFEESAQAMKSLKLKGIAVTKRENHEFLENLRNSVQESHQPSRHLPTDCDLLISIFEFVMSMKIYHACFLRCLEGSLIICFQFPASQPPDSDREEQIGNDVKHLILKKEHLSLYGLPNADSLRFHIEDVEETVFTELQKRRGKKRKADSDDEEAVDQMTDDGEEILMQITDDNQMEVDEEVTTKMENISILSDEEKEDKDATEERGLRLTLFQEELTEIAKSGRNTIVCSEMGTGKTRIAFGIIKDHLHKNPEGRVGILANNAVLVEQHYKALKKLLPDYEDLVIRLSGKKKHSGSMHLFAKCIPIIIMTPALIMNTIESGKDRDILSCFTLLVFDECHHTYKEHIFNQIMRQYHIEKEKKKNVPQILGLTATLGTGGANSKDDARSHILGIMANLDVDILSIVTREKEDYEKFQKSVTRDTILLVKQATEDPVNKVIVGFMKVLESKCRNVGDKLSTEDSDEVEMQDVILRIPSDRNSNAYITWCKKIQETAFPLMGKKQALSTEVMLYSRYLKILSETLEINECICGENAVFALQEKFDRENLGKPSFNPVEDDLAKMVENIQIKMKESLPSQTNERHIDQLLKNLTCHDKQTGVFIIFVKTRELSHCLQRFLSQKNYNVGILTGQAAGDGAPATSQNEQKNVLKKLEAGELQGIIATDIAGEGLDIANCSRAIRYKCVGNEISSMQSMGRVRQSDGTYITFGEIQHTRKEHLNLQRGLLMSEAVEDICQMDEKSLKERLNGLRKDIILEVKRKQQQQKEGMLTRKEHSEYALSCIRCGKFDIDCETIFLISGIHHAVIDPNISKKITLKPMKKKPCNYDGLKQLKEWYHNNCGEKMGTVYLYKEVSIPVLGQGRFVYYRKKDQPRRPLPVVKWKNVPFEKSLKEVGEEQLAQMVGVL